MKILKGYIQRTVTMTILMTTVVFLGLLIFINFFGEGNQIGQGGYGMWQAFVFVLLQLPFQFYMVFPMVALIGSLIGLGLLASHQELTVMRAAGVSIVKITRVILVAMVVIIIVVTVMGELFAPYLNAVAGRYKGLAENSGQALAIGSSVWLKEKNHFIYVNQINSKNQLSGVTLYEFNDQHQLVKNIYARSADYQDDKWILDRVSESDLSPKGVTARFYKTLSSDMTLTPEIFRLALLDPTEMNLVDLWRFIQSRKAEGLKVTSYQINFWQRIYQPFAIIIMMFLALPFVFGSSRTLTIGFRIFIGMILGYAFVMSTNLVAQIGLLVVLPPAISALLPLLIFGCIGIVLIQQFIR